MLYGFPFPASAERLGAEELRDGHIACTRIGIEWETTNRIADAPSEGSQGEPLREIGMGSLFAAILVRRRGLRTGEATVTMEYCRETR